MFEYFLTRLLSFGLDEASVFELEDVFDQLPNLEVDITDYIRVTESAPTTDQKKAWWRLSQS